MAGPLLRLLLLLALSAGGWAVAGAPNLQPADVALQHLRPSLALHALGSGLPNATVYPIALDPNNRLWVGTQDGAAVYDGQRWRTFSMPESSPSNFIRALCAMTDGSIWFGTQDGGIWILSGDRWTHVGEKEGLPSPRVHSILEVPDGPAGPQVWVGTSRGLALREQDRWSVFGAAPGPLPDAWVWRISTVRPAGGPRTFWVATKGGIARYEDGHWSRIGPAEGLPGLDCTDVVAVEPRPGERHLYAALWGRGLGHFDGSRWRLLDQASGLPSPFIVSLASSSGAAGPRLWVCTYDEGLAWLENGRWELLNHARGLPASGVHFALPPRDGWPDLWFSTRGAGLGALDLHGWRSADRAMGLPSSEVTAIRATAEAFWVGTTSGLARCGPRGWESLDLGGPVRDPYVSSILETREDGGPVLWVGTLNGLVRRDARGWRWIGKRDGLVDVHVLTLTQTTAEDGQPILWVCTQDGIGRHHRGRWSWIGAREGLPNTFVYDLLESRDAAGRPALFAATRGGGVGCLVDGRWFTPGRGLNHTNLAVYHLKELRSADGRRWLYAASVGKGLLRLGLDEPEGTWKIFDPRNLPGLPSAVVFRIEQGLDGEVFLTTAKGVVRFRLDADGQPADLHGFGTGDGLPSLSCSVGASFRDPAGRIWVGTLLGLSVLDPAWLTSPAPLPSPSFERVHGSDDQPLAPGGTLGRRSGTLTFEFALHLFHRTEDTMFRTQLLEVEPAPGAWSRQPSRSFAGLSPGRHVLRLWARDHLGRVAGPVDFPFNVEAPLWRNPALIGLYLLGFLLAGLAILRARTRLLRRRNRDLSARVEQATAALVLEQDQLRELNRQKDQILAITSHDLKNPLNGILLHAEGIAEDPDAGADARDAAKSIGAAVQHMLKLVHKLLTLNALEAGRLPVNLECVPLHDVARRVASDWGARARAKQIRLVQEGVGVLVNADPDRLLEVVDNLVSNAVKFTPVGPPERSVILRTRIDDGHGLLEVEDQGPGFTPEDLQKAFGAFQRLGARPTAGESSTGLGLSIVRRMVEAMGGRVEASNAEGQGARLTVRLPLVEVAAAADLPTSG